MTVAIISPAAFNTCLITCQSKSGRAFKWGANNPLLESHLQFPQSLTLDIPSSRSAFYVIIRRNLLPPLPKFEAELLLANNLMVAQGIKWTAEISYLPPKFTRNWSLQLVYPFRDLSKEVQIHNNKACFQIQKTVWTRFNETYGWRRFLIV